MNEPDYHRVLGLGIILLCIAFALFVYMVDAASGGTPFDPPTQARAQRIIGDAYDAKLRPRYPRSGITTRCNGRRHIVCSVHVRRRGVELYWQLTRVDLENGATRTSLLPDLTGCIRVPGKPLTYRSRPLDAS